ncbi:hypothetical protein VOLCADRAFT_105252 [Volvox carteri f. nagariensis]|uniref:EF-hand domain-containing protein n=1 Tax=Volvox carteri f. nagariensis TaxID=3068 RepID=D8TZL4_VOLCA|nr:uncharacterized protein VOLCADRAFT_105252 [Volvox carteri f. nagariensis]EFJ46946.1 hypothetical protein VOLCADRAFT_105252 [Volvox carteri f. nagariensis]|eukprot:XP_002951841.1 hypothetical protein VOLCADRAFT_105252 [Volvox carteri f. nagariensis]
MALQRLRGMGVGRTSASAHRRAVSCNVINHRTLQHQTQNSQEPRSSVASQLLAAGLALGISLAGSPVVAAPQYGSLADIVRSSFEFVDENKDGVVTKEELLRTSKAVAEDVEFMLPDESQLEFAMKLFDLNQDGTLATDELLASIALDGAVGDDAIDADVVKVFDQDGDGFVSLREFKSGVPALGPNGEAAKEYIFSRVDQMVDGDNRLDTQEFANALTLMRTAVLGY